MKFVCDNCQAQYLIADEKVGSRGVKVKCKKCQNTIVVRPEKKDGDGDAAAAPAEEAAPEKEKKSGRSRSNAKMPSVEIKSTANLRTLSASSIQSVHNLEVQKAAAEDEAATAINIATRQPSNGAPDHAEPTDDSGGPAPEGAAPMTNPLPNAAFAEERPTLQMDTQMDNKVPESSVPTSLNDSEDFRAALGKHRAEEQAAAAVDAPVAAPEGASAAAPRGDLENELSGAFDGLFGAGGGTGDTDRAPTRVYSAEQVDQARKQTNEGGRKEKTNGSHARAAEPAAPKPAEKPTVEWYAAIQDEQRGPMPLTEIEGHWLKGDIDKESLVWRTGMADWIPLKEVKDLKYLLDLAPAKKPPPPPAAAPTLSSTNMPSLGGVSLSGVGLMPAADDSSEEAWRPRGMTSVYRAATAAEASVAKSNLPEPSLAPADDGKDSGWMPGAASALASLVDDELSVIKGKKTGAPKQASKDEPTFRPPPAEDDSIEAPLPSLMGKSSTSLPPLSLPPPPAEAPMRQTTSLPTPLSASMGPSPGVSLPFAAPHPAMPPWVKGLLGVGAFAVLLVAGGAAAAMGARWVSVLGPLFNPAKPPLVAENTPPPPAATQPAAAQAAAPAAGNTPPAANPPPAANAGGTPPAGAGGTTAAASPPPAEKKDPPVAAAAADEDKRPKKKDRAEKADRTERKPEKEPENKFAKADNKKSFASAAEDPPPKKEREKEPDPEPVKPTKKKASNADCDPILYPEGCTDTPKKEKASGGGKETLSKTDILTVVKANKGDISRCVAEQRKKDATKAEGVIKMKFTIKKDGKTSGVSVDSADLADAYIGKCLVRSIQGWKFESYTGDELKPITFPFKLDQF